MANELTHKEVSIRGGKAKLDKYGNEIFKEMGQKGGFIPKKAKNDPNYYRNLQKLSVEAKKRKKLQQEQVIASK